jgi:hypothetical protein
MLEVNKASSVEKEEKAVKEITKMIESDVQVTVAELVKRTGLSRAFFYKNPIAVAALKDAREKQKGKSFANPTKVILDKAMEKQIEVLKKENEKLKQKVAVLEEEKTGLQKAVNKKALKVIKGL